MGVLRRAVGLAGYGSLAGVVALVGLTYQCKIRPVDSNDYIYNHTQYARLNPNNSPATHDVCLRKVPLRDIKPELLEKEGKLVEAFCAGVWSGVGYAYQRRYLEKKYRGPETASQLWERKELQQSTYNIGTQITDHFEVVSKSSESIIVRCGDSPRVKDTRDSDGLFEMTVSIDRKKHVAEFGLKSVFFNSLSGYKSVDPPMPWHIQWLHQWYDKILMESAIRNVTR
ncbi:hypothetical protein AMS68_002420 [Peltaster fructicola]|uniref:Uncharacterized protein n=1 Tax=Peltaster fructicola TaxID=286661 RepID=A0A6H0XQC0_9PEZI|nr:hypothetical protein AMS68_002420 [Peltaster fructicola]